MARPVSNPCGTYAAYERHRRAGETPCDACYEGLRRYSRERYAVRVGRPVRRWQRVQCGTNSGYIDHVTKRTEPCAKCRKAHRDYMRKYRRKDVPTLAESIIDVLVTQDRWLSSELIEAMVLDLHPEWKRQSVRRKVLELAANGVIERRTRPFDVRLAVSGAEFRADDEAWERVA